MRSALAIAVCASLALGAAPVSAAGPGPSPPPVVEIPADDGEAVDLAEAAWSRGDWTGVRAVLEPMAEAPDRLSDPRLREKGLCLLADATVNDLDLDKLTRDEMAAGYLERLLDADPDWRLPPAIYSPELFELFVAIQDRRNQQSSRQCQTDLNACRADMAERTADLEDLRERYDALEQRYEDQYVEIRREEARSRAFAAIPAGIGHFYNGEPIFGGVFLGVEVATGAAGLTLILYRSIADGCSRQRGFQRGSLICTNQDIESILRRRKAEEAVGWAFIGSIVLDIFLAQLRFKPFKTQSIERKPRRELDAEGSSTPANRRRNRNKPRANVRPTANGGRNGVSLGVSVRF